MAQRRKHAKASRSAAAVSALPNRGSGDASAPSSTEPSIVSDFEVFPNSVVSEEIGDELRQDIVVVDNRSLIADCLAYCIEMKNKSRVFTFPTVAEWHAGANGRTPGSVILSLSGSLQSTEAQGELEALLAKGKTPPVIIVCEAKEPDDVIDALERGVRGCIVTSSPFAVALQAIRLVMAGGTYAPVTTLLQIRSSSEPTVPGALSALTPRQNEVLRFVCQGKTNQEVAESLKMQLSTVKVHVRNISKKLSARNRTELAAIVRKMQLGYGS